MTNEEIYAVRNLLARIHRDGGQYVATAGMKNACELAEAMVLADRKEIDIISNKLKQCSEELEVAKSKQDLEEIALSVLNGMLACPFDHAGNNNKADRIQTAFKYARIFMEIRDDAAQ